MFKAQTGTVEIPLHEYERLVDIYNTIEKGEEFVFFKDEHYTYVVAVGHEDIVKDLNESFNRSQKELSEVRELLEESNRTILNLKDRGFWSRVFNKEK